MQIPQIISPEQQARLAVIESRLEEATDEAKQLNRQRHSADGEGEAQLDAQLATLMTEINALKSEGVALKLLEALTEKIGEEIVPKLSALQSLLKVAPEVISSIAGPLANSVYDVWEKLEPTTVRYRELLAKQRFAAFTSYRNAGFTDDQAMALVVADARQGTPFSLLGQKVKISSDD